MSDGGAPAMASAMLLFDKAPYVAVVLDESLAILAVNEAGARFLGNAAAQVVGHPLFELIAQGANSGGTWQERLRQSYAQVLAGSARVSIVLSPREGLNAERDLATLASAGGGLWHVCHVPLHDERGSLIAIATYALLLDSIEIASALTSDLATKPTAAPHPTPPRAPAAPMQAAARDILAPADKRSVMPTALPGVAPVDGRVGTGALCGAGIRILMVEDNDDLRTLTVEQLETLGHQVTSSSDAEQALRHLETGSFDLLFTDLTLPKMTGAELARIVLQQHHPMRVVITSGYGRAMANAQSLDALFLPKPYRFADLQEVLRQARLRRDS